MNREGKKWAVNSFTVRGISETALLSVLIAVSAFFKIPGFVPGSEFQMSAPLAVAVCGIYGAEKYIAAGLIASSLCLVLGIHSILNVLVAMTFRLVVYAGERENFLYLFGTDGNYCGERSHIIDFGKRILCSCCRRFSRDDFYYDFVLFFCRIDRAVPVKK